MEFFHILVLALVQALTEFLPVSSSGHLVLASRVFGWDYQGLSFDLALHFGTLLAVLVYFRHDVLDMARAVLAWRPGQPLSLQQRLALGLVLATIPAGLAGLALGDAGALVLRHPLMIAANLIVFGLLLGWADRVARQRAAGSEAHALQPEASRLVRLSLPRAVLVGCAQALALMPGTSRSGATMTAAMFLGLDRSAAARYSFLLSIPVMVLATVHAAWEMRGAASDASGGLVDMALGAAISAVAGWFVIHFFLGVVRRIGTLPFVLYRLLLGVAVIVWYLSTQG